MKRSIGFASGPSGTAGRTTGFNDHQTSPSTLLVCVSAFPIESEAQRQMIQSNARAEKTLRIAPGLSSDETIGSIERGAEKGSESGG
jgi:hypothetical protein